MTHGRFGRVQTALPQRVDDVTRADLAAALVPASRVAALVGAVGASQLPGVRKVGYPHPGKVMLSRANDVVALVSPCAWLVTALFGFCPLAH
jgi:hypothetical protein